RARLLSGRARGAGPREPRALARRARPHLKRQSGTLVADRLFLGAWRARRLDGRGGEPRLTGLRPRPDTARSKEEIRRWHSRAAATARRFATGPRGGLPPRASGTAASASTAPAGIRTW